MPVSGFMTVKAAMLCSNLKRVIAVYIVPMAPSPVRLYRRGIAAAPQGEIPLKPQKKWTFSLRDSVHVFWFVLHIKRVILLMKGFC